VIAKLWDAKSGRLIEPLDNPTPRPKLVDGEGTQPEPLTDGRAPTESRRATARNSSTGDVTKRVLFTSFSPDGKLVVTASDDGTTKIWESETGKRRWAIDKHSGWVYSATFSPDSKSVITANEDGTARLYDVASGKQLTAFIGHSPHVNYASFSPDGQRIATASDDGTAKIWDVASGRLLISFNGQQEEVRKAVFSRDNTRLITVGDGTSAKIWRVDLEKRSPREIDNLVKRFVPFRLKGVEVVPVMDEAEASKPASLASRKN
jgi:WD40 repeat protein